MTSYYLSTPRWTVRVDVADGRIMDTSARYIRHAYGQAWDVWRMAMRRKYGCALWVEGL